MGPTGFGASGPFWERLFRIRRFLLRFSVAFLVGFRASGPSTLRALVGLRTFSAFV